MVYTPATAATFKARFPAFAAVDDDVITGALSRARRNVDDTWLEDDRQEGEHLAAAHDLTLDGIGATREAQLTGFKKLKLGSLELERDVSSSGSSSHWNTTTYGQRFRALLKLNKPGIIAIGG